MSREILRLIDRLKIATPEVSFLPMLKAVIRLASESEVFISNFNSSEAGGFVFLTDAYRYGSYDLLECITAIQTFYHAGNEDVKRMLTRGLEIRVFHNPQVKTPPIKERWNYTTEVQKQWRSIAQDFRTNQIHVVASGPDLRNDVLVDVLLDTAYWQCQTCGDSTCGPGGTMLEKMEPKRMLLCARAVSLVLLRFGWTRLTETLLVTGTKSNGDPSSPRFSELGYDCCGTTHQFFRSGRDK